LVLYQKPVSPKGINSIGETPKSLIMISKKRTFNNLQPLSI